MLDLFGSVPTAVIVAAGICAPLAGWFAMRRARSPVAWFVYGALSGPLALLLLALAPPGRCPSCDTVVDGWATACTRCGSAIGPWWGPPARSAGGEEAGHSGGADSATARPVVASTDSPAPTPMAPAPPVPIVPPPTPRPVIQPSTAPIPTSALYWSTTDPPPAGEVLATGMYLSGNAGLEVGGVYALSRDTNRLRVFGPVDTGTYTVRLDRPLEDVAAVTVDDRLVITARSGRSTTDVILRWMGGMRPADVVAALSSPTSASNDGDRVSG